MEILKHRELIKHLALREIKARYKQSFLGFFWIILNPLCQMLIMSFVFSRIIRTGDLGVPYPIFLFAGLLPWLLFSNSLTSATNVFVENASIIKKVYFPREILIISTLLAKLIDFALTATIFLAMLLIFQMPFTPYMLLFFPILFIQTLFTFSLSLLLSTLNILYRDVQYLFNLFLTLWFYLTPIVYLVDFFPAHYRWIFQINPMAVFINAYREVLLNGEMFSWTSMGIAIVVSSIMLALSYSLFKKLEGVIADVV